jgi:peptide/nickel transport system permease protein
MRYVLARAGQSIILLASVSLLSFIFLQLAPGNYFSEMRLNPQVSDETIQKLREEFALDKPLLTRYGRWVHSLLRGDMGFSMAYNSPAAPLLIVRARNTIQLTFAAMVVSWCIALPLGVWTAAKPGGWVARFASLGSAIVLGTPELLLALLVLMSATKIAWIRDGLKFLSTGNHSGGLRDSAVRMLLPLAVLVITSVPSLLRHTSAAVRETLASPFILAAQAHGIPQSRILFDHALRPALNPLISLLGASLGSLLSGSLLVEVVFGWPGMGPLLVEAILNRDMYVVIGGVMLSAVFLVIAMLIADLLLFAADPRIRTEGLS